MDQLYQYYLRYRRVITDSRKVEPGAIYFALKGANFDGNDFVSAALTAGCSLAVTDRPEFNGTDGTYFVADVLEALQKLASMHRERTGIKVVAITGSNGKTTTKELIAAVLSTGMKVWYTQGNLNNHIGVPLTILAMPEDTDLLVLEMGANHPGEIKFLSELARPDYGLITNIGKAHLEGFGSFEGVKKAKAELYDFLAANGGKAFLNRDNKVLGSVIGSCPVALGYGKDADVIAADAVADPFLSFTWQRDEVSYKVRTKLTGTYNLENALAAITIGLFFGISPEDINRALEAYMPANHRSQMVETNRNRVVLDAYNANPSSMKVALDNFLAMKGEGKLIILGGMKELGAESRSEHQVLVDRLRNEFSGECYLVGSEFEALGPIPHQWIHFSSTESLLEHLKKNATENKLILLKGSRSNCLELAMQYL